MSSEGCRTILPSMRKDLETAKDDCANGVQMYLHSNNYFSVLYNMKFGCKYDYYKPGFFYSHTFFEGDLIPIYFWIVFLNGAKIWPEHEECSNRCSVVLSTGKLCTHWPHGGCCRMKPPARFCPLCILYLWFSLKPFSFTLEK